MEPIDANAASRFLAKHADSVSQNGFLPEHLPLRKLPDLRYSAWESIATNLSTLISTGRIRNAIAECAIVSTQGLRGEDEWRRAYVLLTYMTMRTFGEVTIPSRYQRRFFSSIFRFLAQVVSAIDHDANAPFLVFILDPATTAQHPASARLVASRLAARSHLRGCQSLELYL